MGLIKQEKQAGNPSEARESGSEAMAESLRGPAMIPIELQQSLSKLLAVLNGALGTLAADYFFSDPESKEEKWTPQEEQEKAARRIVALCSCAGPLEAQLKRAYDLLDGTLPPDLNNPLLQLRGELGNITGFAALVPKVGFDKALAKSYGKLARNAAKYFECVKDWIVGSADAGAVESAIPFTDKERCVVQILVACKSREGRTGKEIINAAAKVGESIEQSEITSRLIPALKKKGVGIGNQGAGYFLTDANQYKQFREQFNIK